MIRRNGQISSELLDPRLCDIRVFRSQRAADAAARAGVELDKIEPVKLFVLYLFEHFYDIFYSVCGEIFILEQSRRLAAARRPVDSHEPRLAGVFGRAEVVHLLQEHGIYILHRYHGVDIRLRQADGLLDGGYLRGARRDKKYSDIRRVESCFCLRLAARYQSRSLHGRIERQDIRDKVREADPYQPAHGGARRGYYRPGYIVLGDVFSRRIADELGASRDLEHLVKAEHFERGYDISDIIKIVELPVERRRGQGDSVFELDYPVHRVAVGIFCMVRADADALAAVDAAFRDNMRLAAAHAYSLRGTSLYAVGAAHALLFIEPHRMEIRVHVKSPPGSRRRGRSVSERYIL